MTESYLEEQITLPRRMLLGGTILSVAFGSLATIMFLQKVGIVSRHNLIMTQEMMEAMREHDIPIVYTGKDGTQLLVTLSAQR